MRATFRAWGQRRVDDLLALVDAGVVWRPMTRPGLSMYEGHDGTLRMVEDLHRTWGEFRLEITAFTDLGDGQVLARGAAIREVDGRDVAGPTFESLFTIRNGLVVGMESTEVPAE